MASSSSPSLIAPHTMLPDLLRVHPSARAIFDRYGLRGCGGAHGPAESIDYFARAHGVNVDQLLGELTTAIENPSASGDSHPGDARNPLDELADSIYRRFFKAGVVVVMTAGAVWGAFLLLRIAFAGTFRAITIHEINAHGHAQIFGWVGLFVMGFAYQAFPRMRHTSLWRPDLANMSFYLMVFGVFARSLGEPLFTRPFFRELAVAASMAEIAAIGLFAAVLLNTFRRSGKPYQRHDAFILASLVFFLLQAVYDLGLLYATTATVSREALLQLVSTYQAPLRDLQIHGFAMFMILGVGLRMFPALFGFRAPGLRLVRASFILLVAAVLSEACFFVLMRQAGSPWTMGALYVSMLVLAATSVGLTLRWGALARPTESDRSVKFVRAAVTWLHVSMLMLVLAPLYTYVILPAAGALTATGRQSVEIGFSHAYSGAVRHAITVGFISLMILGMAAKVVPTLNGVDIRRLRPLWTPFVLVNLGCLMRVGFQIGTEFRDWAYPLAGLSGLLEVSGIAVWGLHLWRIMSGWNPTAAQLTKTPSRISEEDKIGQIVEWFPQTLPVLLDFGFKPLANPILRRTIARTVSVKAAAVHLGLEVDQLLTALNLSAFGNRAGSLDRRVSLPLLG